MGAEPGVDLFGRSVPAFSGGALEDLHRVVMELHVDVLDLLRVRLRQRLHLYGCQGSRAIRVNPYDQGREIVLGRRVFTCKASMRSYC